MPDKLRGKNSLLFTSDKPKFIVFDAFPVVQRKKSDNFFL